MYMSNCDVGEIFPKLMLDPSVRSHVGVELIHDFPEEAARKGEKLKELWSRMMMDFAPSPYFITKDMLIIEEVVQDNRIDVDNVFR